MYLQHIDNEAVHGLYRVRCNICKQVRELNKVLLVL